MYINSQSICITKINDDEFIEKVLKKIENVTKKIQQYFDITNIRKIKINIYTDKKHFIHDIVKYYESGVVPEYCKGTIQEGKIYYYLEQNYTERKSLYVCQIVHEYIHILYNEYMKKRRKIRLVR